MSNDFNPLPLGGRVRERVAALLCLAALTACASTPNTEPYTCESACLPDGSVAFRCPSWAGKTVQLNHCPAPRASGITAQLEKSK